jgi:hypothetical protein
MRALAMSIINKMTDAEIERLFFPQPHQPDISIREQCLATLRGCRKSQTVSMRYPIPARVAETLETMSLRAALDTHEAIVRMLKEIVVQEAK